MNQCQQAKLADAANTTACMIAASNFSPVAVAEPSCDPQMYSIGPNVRLDATMVPGGMFNVRRQCSNYASVSGWGSVPMNSTAALATFTPLDQGCYSQKPYSEEPQILSKFQQPSDMVQQIAQLVYRERN